MYGSTPAFPWSSNFSWTELAELAGYALLLGAVVGLVVGLCAYLVLHGIARRPVACSICQHQEQDPAVTRAIAIGGIVALAIILLVPVMYRQGDRVSNAGNTSSSASASQQEIESLEDTIAGQLEFRAASMGYEVLDTDVSDLTTTVQVGSCDVVLDMAGAVPQFIVIDDVIGVMRFDSLNPWPLLRDARQNLDHPLRRCFTRDQLDPAA